VGEQKCSDGGVELGDGVQCGLNQRRLRAIELGQQYANDTRRPDALIAVTAAMNQSKSDRDPAEWLPPNRDAWCRYADAWIAQKAAWKLTIDPAERDALRNVLTSC